MLTTKQAAERLGITPRRVLALIATGRLSAERIGRDWLIRPADLDAVRVRTAGRPRKELTHLRVLEPPPAPPVVTEDDLWTLNNGRSTTHLLRGTHDRRPEPPVRGLCGAKGGARYPLPFWIGYHYDLCRRCLAKLTDGEHRVLEIARTRHRAEARPSRPYDTHP